MAKTRSMTRNQNRDDASSKKSDVAPWSDFNHDLLFLVMMKLGVIDFISFGGVCKSWRSLARSNEDKFMASKPPMYVSISIRDRMKECYLEDFEGRKFKTILPHSVARDCIGLTCGYLIMFGRKTRDFLLVNPVTRHGLHFPAFPFHVSTDPTRNKAILVFSPSVSRWVFVMARRLFNAIWFSEAGSGTWTTVTATSIIVDLHFFKGKIYALTTSECLCEELNLYPEPKLTLLETKNNPKRDFFYLDFASSGENLYVMDPCPEYRYKVQELDFGEMEWVSPEKTIEKHALFLSDLNHGSAINPESWAKSWSQYGRYAYLRYNDKSGGCRLFTANMWYFPHDCLNVDVIDE